MNIALTRLLREELFCDRKEGTNIRIARYKLNVYGAGRLLRLLWTSPYQYHSYPEPGSFLKPHVDTPRDENMFGSLVIVFPTVYEGGALVLRDAGEEWAIIC